MILVWAIWVGIQKWYFGIQQLAMDIQQQYRTAGMGMSGLLEVANQFC